MTAPDTLWQIVNNGTRLEPKRLARRPDRCAQRRDVVLGPSPNLRDEVALHAAGQQRSAFTVALELTGLGRDGIAAHHWSSSPCARPALARAVSSTPCYCVRCTVPLSEIALHTA